MPTDSLDPSDNALENAPDDGHVERPRDPARHLSSGSIWRQPAGAVPGSPSYSFGLLTEAVWDVGRGRWRAHWGDDRAGAGCAVALLEAREIGSGTTGSSTAKGSLLQGTTISAVRETTSAATARAYVDGNREA